MNKQFTSAINPLYRKTIVSMKGGAAPSPVRQTQHTDKSQNHSESVDHMEMNALCALIKRANPVKQELTPIEAPSEFYNFRVSTIPAVKTPCTRKRRQLTVRLAMEEFSKLDQYSRQTGKSYQEIQSQALETFLTAINNS